MYLSGLQPLSGGSALTSGVTIVGTKYCAGGFDFVINASRNTGSVERTEQCLFLVADPKSNDVVLHNGKRRLGSVAEGQRAVARQIIDQLSEKHGQDQVLVCYMPYIDTHNERSIRNGSSFKVMPTHYVYERLARKFSDKYRKD